MCVWPSRKESSTQTGEEVSPNILLVAVTNEDAVEADLPNREQSSGYHAADPFCLSDTIDAAEVVVPCADPATTIAPQPSMEVQFQPLEENLQGFYTIMPTSKHVRKRVIAVTARRHTSF